MIIKFIKKKKMKAKGGEGWKPIAGVMLPVPLVKTFTGRNIKDEALVKEFFNFKEERIIKLFKFVPTESYQSGVLALVYDRSGNRLDPRLEEPGKTKEGYIDMRVEIVRPGAGEAMVRRVLADKKLSGRKI